MIRFKNIFLNYNGKPLLENLSFEIKEGEKVILFGKSGSGKSSLFSILLGFIEPDNGEAFFDGTKVDEKSAWEIRKKIAYIDQNVSLGNGNVSDKIHSIKNFKTNSELNFSNDEINELIKYFALPTNLLEKSVDELSGGEKQRLAIIISVLLKRNVFLLDEITSALDEALKNKAADFFINNNDFTCLIISHDPVWLENEKVKIFDLDEKKWRR